MSIDALSLAAIRNEVATLAQGYRIQKIIPTGPLSIVLEVYNSARRQRVQIILSADAQNARFHLIQQKASQQPGEPTPFLLLLRKYVRYGIITRIEQLPFERIIILTIEKKFPAGKRPYFGAVGSGNRPAEPEEELEEDRDEEESAASDDFELYESKLVCEMMGRHSNTLLLSEDSVIIDALKRVGSSKNRYRLILPHQPYVAPPPQEKQAFHLESPASFTRLMSSLTEKQPDALLWQTLVSTFSGVGPQLGRELAYRMAEAKGMGGPGQPELKLRDFQRWEGLYSEMRSLLKPLNPGYSMEKEPLTPTLVRDETDEIVAFAPYEIHQFRKMGLEPEAVESVSLAAEEYYGQTESVGGQSQRKAQVASIIGGHQERLRRRISSMEASLKKAESAEELKRKGEAIYANLWQIQPGMTRFEADGLVVELDPDRSPSENAQHYFREYDKGRQAMAGVPELLEEARYEMSYLDEMLTALDLAETYEDIVSIRAELSENGYGQAVDERESTKSKAASRPLRAKKRKLPQTPTFVSPDGFTIYVGKSAQHNDFVTFELGEKSDIWLHARGIPGSHVIIKTGGREVPDKTLEMAAGLAAYYSKGQNNTKVEVVYAPQKYVRKVKGPHPGLVTYSQEYGSINIKPNSFGKRRNKPGAPQPSQVPA
ncbi:MAG TPA: NFACT RNA binding domain-containing protein [Chloroflexia bacterium]|nr:NFACT RNA binding domain-containing protein [Chloroflexia bacterium]